MQSNVHTFYADAVLFDMVGVFCSWSSKSNSSSVLIGWNPHRFHRRCRGCVGKGRKGHRAGPGLRDRCHTWQARSRQPRAVQASNQSPRDGRRSPKL